MLSRVLRAGWSWAPARRRTGPRVHRWAGREALGAGTFGAGDRCLFIGSFISAARTPACTT